jgi:hypothetical protein
VASQDTTGGPACNGFDDVPCRLVYSPRLAWNGGQLTDPIYTTRSVVGTRLVADRPVAGVDVELYHRVGSDPERFEPTGLHAVTGADGSYRIVLPMVGDDPWYTVAAATPIVPTWAGRGTAGSVAR